MYKIFYLLIHCSVFLSFLGVSGSGFARVPHSGKTTTLGDSNWVETKLRQYPELLWLMDNNESKTQESLPSLDFTDVNISLLNETLTSLVYLHAFLSGSHSSYLLLKQLNPKLVDYTFKDFLSMHKKFKNFSKSFSPEISQDEFVRIVETAVALKNIYSSTKARKLFENYFVSSTTSNEEFYIKSFQVLNSFPELSPSFRRLTKRGQNLVSHARTFINYKNLLSLSLDKQVLLKDMSPSDLNFDLLIFLIDLCGTENYSLSAQNDFFALIKNIQQTFDFQTQSLMPIYKAQLHYEGEKYGESPDSLQNISHIRLAKAFNLASTEEFSVLKQVIASLDQETQDNLMNYMAHPENNPLLIGIYELKELVSHILNTIGHKDSLKKSLSTTLAMIVQGISCYKEYTYLKPSVSIKQLSFSSTKIDSLLLDNLDNLIVNINKNGEISFSMSSNNYQN